VSSKTSVLEPLRVRVRRFQFIMGLGFIALIAGSILSVALTLRLSVRIQSVPVGVLRVALAVLLENLWVLGVLPLLCYGAARIMELRPWTTAGGAALTGAAFVNALAFVQNGANGLWLGGVGSFFSVVAFAVGLVISARAVMMGRDAAAQQTVKSQARAQERKSEYDEFLRAAEQGGARLEQREAQAAAVASPSEPSEPVAATQPEVAEAASSSEPSEPVVAALPEVAAGSSGAVEPARAEAEPAQAQPEQVPATGDSDGKVPAA